MDTRYADPVVCSEGRYIVKPLIFTFIISQRLLLHISIHVESNCEMEGKVIIFIIVDNF